MIALKSIGTWLLKNPAVVGLGLALAASLIVIAGKNSDIAFYKGETTQKQQRIEALNRDVGTLVANQQTLTKAVESQNSAIDTLAAAAAQRDAKFDAAFAQLQASRTATNKAVAALLARPTPADACKGAFDLVKELTQ